MTRNLLRAGALACALMTSTAMCTQPALAQTAGLQEFRHVDGNGVDLVHGVHLFSFEEGSIGSGAARLALVRQGGVFNDQSQWDGYKLTRTSTGMEIALPGGTRESFGLPGGNGSTVTRTNGSRLTRNAAWSYTYRRADGTRIEFSDPTGSGEGGLAQGNFCATNLQTDCELLPEAMIAPNGQSVTFLWDVFQTPDGAGGTSYLHRLGSVSNSYGYSIAFSYASDSPAGAYLLRTGASFLNTNLSSAPQASVSYATPSSGVTQVTDMAGRVWRIAASATGIAVRRPGASADTFTTSSSGGVLTVTNEGVTTSYARSVNGSIATMTVTDALNRQTVIESDLNKGRPSWVKDALNRTTSYTYDGSNRLTRVTAHEGNYVQYTLDGRGNVTQTDAVGKPNSGVATITTYAAYDPNCANPVICNLPTSITDARGNVTEYQYDATHGGVVSVTAPAPSAGATRPQTRFTYSLLNGEYQLTAMSACASGTAPGCVGSAAESRTVIGYDAQGNVSSVQQRDGTGQLSAAQTMTYTAMGDVASVDGPLWGTGDTSRVRYNTAREVIGTISADPDGGWGLKHRASRNIIDATTGLVTRVDIGTVNSQSDADWQNMAVHQSVETDYNANARATVQRLKSGGTTYSLAQMSYDAMGRPECSAQRMNPAAFVSLPASACSLGTEGTFGPDRISKVAYDELGRVREQRSAVGTADEAIDASVTFRLNGGVETLTDGKNNRTTIEYDGHDRPVRTRFPVATVGANQSSTTDYEELGYDAAGNVTSRRVRDGQVIGFTYDALDRPTLKNLPGTEPDVSYGYDLLGQLTSAATASQTLSFTYDALGRRLTEAGPLGTVTSGYDAAGRRTRLAYPDGFAVLYNYLTTGELQSIDRDTGGGAFSENLISFEYDDLGRRAGLSRANGTGTGYSYDAVGRLASIEHDLADTARDVTFSYGYNPAGQIASRTTSNDAYAAAVSNANQSDSHNGLNQLATAAGATVNHDAKGNITTEPSSPMTYGYSSENLLTSATGPYGNGTLTYDPVMRLWDSGTGGRTRVLHDGEQRIAEYSQAGGQRNRVVFGPGIDEPLIEYSGSGLSTVRHVYADERGSIVGGADAAGNSVGVGTYDDYGQALSFASGRFGYAGQPYETVSDLQYSRARFYNQRRGRFMQPDPIGYGDGMNMYEYVGGDPVNFTDPSGLKWRRRCVSVGGEGGCGWYWDEDNLHLLEQRYDDGPSDSVGPCLPTDKMVFRDARTATSSAARATAIENNSNPRFPLREYHARVFSVTGGFRFQFTEPGPKRGGSVSLDLRTGNYGSSHNHERDSGYGTTSGQLSSSSTNSRGNIRLPNDVDSYRSFLQQSDAWNRNARNGIDIRSRFHVGLADSSGNRPGIYVWNPGDNLNAVGQFVGPILCAGQGER